LRRLFLLFACLLKISVCHLKIMPDRDGYFVANPLANGRNRLLAG